MNQIKMASSFLIINLKRIRGIILKEGDIFSFGEDNIPFGNYVQRLKKKVITFEICSEENHKETIQFNDLKIKELENIIEDLKEKNQNLIETLNRRNKNLDETFPNAWKEKKIIVIVDSNIFVEHGVKVFDVLKIMEY